MKTKVFDGIDFEEVYKNLLISIRDEGQLVGKCRELLNIDLYLPDARKNFVRLPRNWIWAAWELYDRLDPDFKNPGTAYLFRPRWRKKLESEGNHFCYHYGDVFSRMMPEILLRLKSKATRECVLAMWQNDYLMKSKEAEYPRSPCTIAFHFMIREDKLNLFVDMRTNDVINLLPYDVWHHTLFQAYIADKMKLEVGWYNHKAHMAYWQKRRDGSYYVDNAIERLSTLQPIDYKYSFDNFDTESFYKSANLFKEGILQSLGCSLKPFAFDWWITLARSLDFKINAFPITEEFKYIWTQNHWIPASKL